MVTYLLVCFLNNKTGEITGNTGEILNKTNIFDEIKFPRLLPVPQWVTPRFVDIVVVKEKEPVDYQLELEYPEVYGALYHRIIAGALPFGLELSKTGRITGAVNEILQAVPYSEHTLATITPNLHGQPQPVLSVFLMRSSKQQSHYRQTLKNQ